MKKFIVASLLSLCIMPVYADGDLCQQLPGVWVGQASELSDPACQADPDSCAFDFTLTVTRGSGDDYELDIALNNGQVIHTKAQCDEEFVHVDYQDIEGQLFCQQQDECGVMFASDTMLGFADKQSK